MRHMDRCSRRAPAQARWLSAVLLAATAAQAQDAAAPRPTAVRAPIQAPGFEAPNLVPETEPELPAMVSAPIVTNPPCFYLQSGTNRVYGPFPYVNRAQIGEPPSTFDLVVSEGQMFSLQSRDGAVHYGPFPMQHGAPIQLGSNTLTLVRPLLSFSGQIVHPGLSAAPVTVRLIAADAGAARALSLLRQQFQSILQELKTDTAPVRLRTPVVLGPVGTNRSQWVNRSAADVQRAERKAQGRAEKSLAAFMDRNRTAATQTDSRGAFAFIGLEPGAYIVCAQTTVRSAFPTANSAGDTVLWWAVARLNDGPARVVFNGNTVVDWRDLFVGQKAAVGL
jgi:hypothetical protein